MLLNFVVQFKESIITKLSSFEDKGLLRILRMNQLHLSEDKYQEKVKEFVVAERNALKSKVLDLI